MKGKISSLFVVMLNLRLYEVHCFGKCTQQGADVGKGFLFQGYSIIITISSMDQQIIFVISKYYYSNFISYLLSLISRQHFQCLKVGAEAFAHEGGDAGLADIGDLTEIIPGFHIGHVHFIGRNADRFDRVEDRY